MKKIAIFIIAFAAFVVNANAQDKLVPAVAEEADHPVNYWVLPDNFDAAVNRYRECFAVYDKSGKYLPLTDQQKNNCKTYAKAVRTLPDKLYSAKFIFDNAKTEFVKSLSTKCGETPAAIKNARQRFSPEQFKNCEMLFQARAMPGFVDISRAERISRSAAFSKSFE